MDVEGTVDVGLRVSPDAVLTIATTGKIIQTKGQALVVGTIKAADIANGTVTITTKGGTDLVIYLAGDSDVKLKGSKSNLAALAANIGSEVIAEYNTETKATTELAASTDAKAKADVGATLNISGTIKSVDAVAGTLTVVTDSGAELVFKAGSDAKVQLDGAATSLLGLGAKVGSRVEGEYDAGTGKVGELQAQGETSVTDTGTLKAVDVAAGKITLATRAGTDITLEVASKSKVLVNGALVTLAALKSMIGSEVTAEYSQRTKVASDLHVRGRAEQSATVTGTLKAVNPIQGTVTIATAGGQEVALNVTAASSVAADGAISTLADLSTKIGAQVTAQYNTQSKAATSVNLQTQAQVQASVSGTLKSLDATAGTITITPQSGADLVLKVTAETKLLLDNSASALSTLAANIGAQVTAEYDTQTKAATSIHAKSEAKASTSVSGTLKAVNPIQGTVTIARQGSADLVLAVTLQSRVRLNGASSILAVLATKIGSQVSIEYNAQTNMITTLDVKG
jgi:hypothetical protein